MSDRVILTPHVAGYSPRIAERHLGVLLENVCRFVRGEPLKLVGGGFSISSAPGAGTTVLVQIPWH
jgi:hypothetical protein